MPDNKIKIQNLYKIFGSNPQSVLPLVKDGMSKQQLMEEYNHVLGLKDINIDLPERQLSVIMGLSGSGKSTLIRHINRLIEPTSGKVFIDGKNILEASKKSLQDIRRHKISMVFQKFGLLIHKTVFENVAYGLSIQGINKKEIKKRCDQWIARVGLEGFEDHYPSQLSGGMQQRVGLARALSTDAEILLMDEAFSALDPLIRYDMQSILLELQEELHKTIVFITHDLDEALRLGDKVKILRDGELIQEDTPQNIILHPKDDYIFNFVKDINRARVLYIKAIMTTGEHCDGPDMPYNTVLEDAIQTVVNTPNHAVNVVGKNKEKLGCVNLQQIIKAVARPELEDGLDSSEYY